MALTRPMNPTELTVAVIEAGYETSMARTSLRNTIGRELRKGKFAKGPGGKWSALLDQ